MGGEKPRASAPIASRPNHPLPTSVASALSVIPTPHPSFPPLSVIPTPLPSIPAPPPPPYPRPLPVIPAQAGTQALPTPQHPLLPNSSLPPSRGEVRWGVKSHEPTHQSHCAPIAHPHLSPALRRSYAPSVIPAQAAKDQITPANVQPVGLKRRSARDSWPAKPRQMPL